MKLKKILALACSLVMCLSMIAATSLVADAAVDGVTATLEFAGYETKGAATFAVINVKATIPDTLVPYKLNAADWVETFEDTYEGTMIQSVGFDIPNVDGLAYTASLSSCAEYVQLQNNTSAKKVTIYAANTGALDTYYAGEVDTLATLYYRITGDVAATYEIALTDAVIGLVDVDASTGAGIPREYTFGDFEVTNATVKPADPEPTVNMVSTTEIVDVQKADTVEGEATDYQYGSAIGISGTTDGAIFKKMIWAITVGSDRLYSEAFDVSLEGDFKVAATFINGNKVDDNNVAFSDAGAIFTDGVEDYFTNDADAANKAE